MTGEGAVVGNPRLLAIDDEPEIGKLISIVAHRSGFDVQVTTDPRTFQATYRAWRPDFVVLDLGIPGIDGVELLRFLREEHGRSGILLVSGMGQNMLDVVKHLGTAYGLTIAATIAKPFRAAELTAVLEELRSTQLSGGSPLS